ncbi:lipase family protein [Solimonas marina]|uniref:Lipase n=1 Tax=Solimonas marina TaxID=2714601 RepID=A0A969WDW1_9GAMM|nr:lipase family protein [Solimonas marina]NKF23581.1 lipase [Solimonas marina]
MIRTTLLLAACLTCAAASAAAARPALPVGDGGVPAFYDWGAAIPDNPGHQLRHEPLPASHRLAHAARGMRVLYTSTDGIGGKTPVVVSGMLYLPRGTPPPGGWPLLTWGHGTTGGADVCAPSAMRPDPKHSTLQRVIDAWLARGYAVAATDYQGLGVPGPHPYLQYRPEGYSVLDIARAAIGAHPGTIANQVIIGGFSQGSGAALGAALLAPTYAPDLHVLGTVATGLVVRPKDPGGAPQIKAHQWASDHASVDTAFVMLFLIGDATTMHPGLDPRDYVTSAGRPLLTAAQHGCLDSMIDVSNRHRLTLDKAYTAPFMPLLDEIDEAGKFPSTRFTQPVFTATGLADTAAPPTTQYNFISAMCYAGTTVDWRDYPQKTHEGAAVASIADALDFADRLRAGDAIASNCAALKPPPPESE